jgi:hypothetical protein
MERLFAESWIRERLEEKEHRDSTVKRESRILDEVLDSGKLEI